MKLVLLLSAYLISSYCNSFTIPSICTFKRRQRLTISNILLNEHTIDINVDVNVDIKTENNIIRNNNNNIMLSQINNTSSNSSYNTSYTNGQQTSASFSITRRDDSSSINLPIICNAQQQKAYSSELSYATNFTKTIHDIVIQDIMSSSTIVDLPLQFFEFQWQNDNLATPLSISEDTNNMSTNCGVLDLIKSLIPAENEQQIDNALANDFTTADTANLSRGESAGIGCGLQIYLKGKLVLTVGGGGGGGRSYTSSSEEGYECGGGGGASIFLPDSISGARVGGGHGMQAGYETEHNPTLFIKQLQILLDILTNESNINDIAIMGGGGGGGSGFTTNSDNTSSSNGRGYGFGFEIGSIEGINLAKKMMSTRTNDSSASGENRNPLNLPEHLLNEEWAAQVAEYIDPPENEKEEEFQARAKL